MSDDLRSSPSGALPAATPVRLDELVAYLPGSVVSRTLAKSPAGTLTLFAFEAGQELSEHSAPFDAHVTILDGASVWTVGGQTVPVVAGETVRLPANVPHAVSATERFKMLLVMIRG